MEPPALKPCVGCGKPAEWFCSGFRRVVRPDYPVELRPDCGYYCEPCRPWDWRAESYPRQTPTVLAPPKPDPALMTPNSPSPRTSAMDPPFDPTPTKYDPLPLTVLPPADTERLTPEQRRWLFRVGLIFAGYFFGWQLPPLPPLPPLPAEAQQQLADTAAAVKRIEAGQAQVMRAAGLPKQ